MPRTNFNSSRLARLLADLSLIDAAGSKQAFAERLGQWLDFSDAITLHAAHGAASMSPATSVRALARDALQAEFAGVRTALVNSITASCSPDAGEKRIRLPAPNPDAAIEGAAYAPYQRFYQAHQGEMELQIRPLRSKARQALSAISEKLRLLATLDAALDQILSGRERQVLSGVPALLEMRFAHWLGAHQQQLVETGQADAPARWTQPGGWLADFGNELKMVLLAELDLRLQPALGLLEALSNEAA